MTTLAKQTAAMHELLDIRAHARAARADFKTALRAAVEAGVTWDRIADELMRDSLAHGELDALQALQRDLSDQIDERVPASCWP